MSAQYVKYVKEEPSDWYPYWQLETIDGDHMRVDEQGYDDEEQNKKLRKLRLKKSKYLKKNDVY